MSTFVLIVRRQSGFTAAGASTKVMLDGISQASLRIGQRREFTLPRKPVNVTLLTPVALGKDIEKTVTINPGDAQVVTLLFSYKFNAKTLLPFGAFTQQQAFIETQIFYDSGGAAAQAASSAYSASAQQSQQAPPPPPDERKFCTNCGTANPKDALFCQECGNKFE